MKSSRQHAGPIHRFHNALKLSVIILPVAVILLLGPINIHASPITFINSFDIPGIPDAQFLSAAGLASDGRDLFTLVRYTAFRPPDQQYTIIRTSPAGDLLSFLNPFGRGGALAFHDGHLVRGHDPVPGVRTTEIILFDPYDGTVSDTLPSPTATKLTGLTTDGNRLFGLDLNNTIFIMDPKTGWVIESFDAPRVGNGLATGLAFYGGHLFASSWDRIAMLNPDDGSLLDSFDPGIGSIGGMTFLDERLFVMDRGSARVNAYAVPTPEPASVLLLAMGLAALTVLCGPRLKRAAFAKSS